MSKNKAKCANCAYYNPSNMICTTDGKLSGIEMTPSLADAEHDCGRYDEVTYRLTPKSLLSIALEDAGVDVTIDELTLIWDSFEAMMEKHGYVKSKTDDDE